jgi:hypothetical protein
MLDLIFLVCLKMLLSSDHSAAAAQRDKRDAATSLDLFQGAD